MDQLYHMHLKSSNIMKYVMSIVLVVHYHMVLCLSRCFAFLLNVLWQNWTQAAASNITLQPFCSFKKPFRAEFCRNGTSSSFVVNDFSSRQTSAGFADTEVMWASEDERILQSEMPASPQRGT